MNILEKLKETAASVLPVAVIVFILGFTFAPEIKPHLFGFGLGSVFLILGLTIFLLGVDLSISPVGEQFGAKLTAKRSLSLMLAVAFFVGFVVTAAEPDIQVFGDQVKGVFQNVNKQHLVFSIAGGVGFFIALGLLRIMTRFPYKLVMLLSYLILLSAAYFAPKAFVGIAFDSGGATTGPMTVPFIMAIGLGVSAVRADRNASFGLTGIASVGPVLAVLLYSIFTAGVDIPKEVTESVDDSVAATSDFAMNMKVVTHSLHETFASIWPLIAMTLVAQFLLLKMTLRQMTRVFVGYTYTFIGLALFLTGVNGGFMQAGQALGAALGEQAFAHGGLWYALMIGVGLAFGAIIVCAEPAVWVLSEQVEQISDGMIRRKALLVFLSIGTALAIALAMWRAVAGFNIAWILIPGYALAMALMPFCPQLFSGIAFDSGGVASGPLTSSFVLSFALGAASCGEGGNDAFGVIALVAMMPLIAIQVMGIIFDRKSRRREASATAAGGGK